MIVLPQAIDRGRGLIAYRPFPLTLYLRRDNQLRLAMLERITYFPAWARVTVAVTAAAQVVIHRVAGAAGIVPLDDLPVRDDAPTEILLENHSIDTDVTLTLFSRAFQSGEG